MIGEIFQVLKLQQVEVMVRVVFVFRVYLPLVLRLPVKKITDTFLQDPIFTLLYSVTQATIF
jgi:hypothetical protein